MIEQIGVLGIGRIGLCLALNLSRIGFQVYGYDIRRDYVAAIKSKTYKTIEPDVTKMLVDNETMIPTTDIEEVLSRSEALFVSVGTASTPEGPYDHQQVDALISDIVDCGPQDSLKTLIINCNVYPGFSDKTHDKLKDLNYKVSYNPEWVAQGQIVNDQLYPELVVIGESDQGEGDKIEYIYQKLCKSQPSIHRMDRLSAEITKVALNCYLTTKISFANMVGDLALKVGAEPEKILSAIGNDSRIGLKYFKYGFGYGGPCFPIDNEAFIHYANSCGVKPALSIATQEANEKHIEYQIEEFISNHSLNEEVIMDYVTYKKGVDIILNSQQLLFAVKLAEMGYNVFIKDNPVVQAKVRELYGDLFRYV